MRLLKDVLAANTNNVLYIFYDFETTKINTYSDTQKYMCLSSSVCNGFVQDVRKSKTAVSIVYDAAGKGINFGMIL